jgi:histidine triad (HIT) family protein
MSDDCVFCSILAGGLPARIVHQTDAAVAFLDVNPLAPGHTLVVPREHEGRLEDLSGPSAAGVFVAVHDLVPVVESAVDADGVTVAVNDGPAAGQEVPHVHVHLVPRFGEDGGGTLHDVAGERPDLSEAELDDIAAAIEGEGA